VSALAIRAIRCRDSPMRRFHYREEVKEMTYTKPEIVPAGCAAQAIQGSKPFGPLGDIDPKKHQTFAAYEADE
jgi:hypothetical protein